MKKPDIVKPSFRYFLLFRLAKFFFRIYYRRMTVTGRENVPRGVPLIYAANHQNALMDALAVLFAANRPVVFLARADIFKKKAIAALLNLLKMLPVYRIRDGFDAMGNNQQIFEDTVRVLKAGLPLALLPEGTHTSIKHLQQLKKGICRIAFLAEESSDFNLNLHIVPVGIDYSSYQKAGTHLLVNYGPPIAIADYYGLYKDNPQKAIAQLRDDLALAIKKIMIHVENVENYKEIISLTDIMVPAQLSASGLTDNRVNRFFASREVIQLIENASSIKRLDLGQAKSDLQAYHNLLQKYGLKNKLFESKLPSAWMFILLFMLSVLLLPVHLYGMVFNYIPYKLPQKIANMMKDKQFISSVNFGLGFVLFPLWYVLLMVIVWIITGNGLLTVISLISWPFAGLFVFYHYKYLRKLIGKLRLYRLKARKPDQYRQLMDLRQKLIQMPDMD
ncbi:MAG: 1-acyl-sn-glycerol-3-phosphate acyltransferase [Lentimicrobiaceae bacterium]|nr:1-acyl-sn-glycerol-3-phosphate acyltransferase [Lentimicrobiaceae bacterium]MCB9023961.1 1-acyl-sn-glycerol-3-phosphate acyltransferase [Lentimicrobiaceae bacterium]